MNNVDFTNFLNSILASVTTTQVLSVLASIIGIGMTFFLVWFGVRKMTAQFTEMVGFGRMALSGDSEKVKEWYRNQALKANGWTKESLAEALRTNSAYSDATMTKTIGEREIAPRPIEPIEPSGKPMTKAQRKEFDDYYATHDSFGHKLGYDKRQWENYYKKNAYKYKKKNNYKKNYYYDSRGNKYYK